VFEESTFIAMSGGRRVALPAKSSSATRSYVLRLLPALANAMATACLIAVFFVGGWLVPIDPSFFQSSTNVLILLLTVDWLDPFLSGMMSLHR
jgi:NADH:ubiquinone oxidoreductase subunit H